MKNLIRLISILILFSFSLTGCYYDKESELYPNGPDCDTAGVIYYKSVASIMLANCNTCHSPSNPSGNVITSTYEGLSTIAKDGNLWYAVNWEGSPQTNMPQGATDTLSICDRTKIKKWIDAGSLNN